MTTCAICTRHRHLPDDDCTTDCTVREADLGIICSRCAQRIRSDLDTLIDTWALTEDPNFPGQASGGTRAKTSPLPGGTEWMDWRQGSDLFGVLTTWVRDWCETYVLAGPKRADLTSLTGWLRAHLPHAANSHPAIDDFADEIRTLAQRGRRLAGEVPERGQRVPCPTDDCTRTLRIRTADLEETVRCRSCGIQRTSGQILLIASRSDSWVSSQIAADVVGVNTTTIQRWAKSGQVKKDQGLYWLPDVRARAAKRRTA